MPATQKITLGEMRAASVRGLLICCSDYHCSHAASFDGLTAGQRGPVQNGAQALLRRFAWANNE
jgi:hypothetical protein